MKKRHCYLTLPLLFLFLILISPTEILFGQEQDKVMVSFKTTAKLGRGTLIQKDQLSILISTNFSGDVTDKGIKEAKWKNITKRFKLSPVVEESAYVSTNADVSDLITKGQPFYIALKYETPAQTPEYGYVRWQIGNFKVKHETASGSTTLMNQAVTPFELYHKGILEEGRCVSDMKRVVFRGNIKKANVGSPTEDWAVSAAIVVK